MIKCRVCKRWKFLDEYYPIYLKNYNYICKSCYCEQAKKRRKENPEKWKKISREQSRKWIKKNHERRLEQARKGRNKNKQKILLYARAYVEKYPERNRAHGLRYWAVKNGKLKPKPCKICGDLNVHSHHPDYSKPLEVIWLCPKHHKRQHVWIE